jgi:hypothetical protein
VRPPLDALAVDDEVAREVPVAGHVPVGVHDVDVVPVTAGVDVVIGSAAVGGEHVGAGLVGDVNAMVDTAVARAVLAGDLPPGRVDQRARRGRRGGDQQRTPDDGEKHPERRETTTDH